MTFNHGLRWSIAAAVLPSVVACSQEQVTSGDGDASVAPYDAASQGALDAPATSDGGGANTGADTGGPAIAEAGADGWGPTGPQDVDSGSSDASVESAVATDGAVEGLPDGYPPNDATAASVPDAPIDAPSDAQTGVLASSDAQADSESGAGGTATVQDFTELLGQGCPGNTVVNTPYACAVQQTPAVGIQTPWVFGGTPQDPRAFLRLAEVPPVGAFDHNAIAFARTAPGAHAVVLADFDFRMTPMQNRGRADGMGFALLNTAIYPAGAVAAPQAAEAPSFPGSIGVGFDIYTHPGDIGDVDILPNFSDNLSLYYNGALLNQFSLEKVTDIASGLWHHARVLVEPAAGGEAVSVWVTPPCGTPFLVANEVLVPGAVPYESRAWFGARSGGEAANFDLARVRVDFMDAASSWVSFDQARYAAQENQGSVILTVVRGGDVSGAATVGYETVDGTARQGVDYEQAAGVIAFAPGQASVTVTVNLIDDAQDETTLTAAGGRADVPSTSEAFTVKLVPLAPNVQVAGPALAEVDVFDDEGSRLYGQWGQPMCWNIIAMNATLLPTTGNVIYWDRLGNVAQYNPTTGVAAGIDGPGYDLFCSGHALLPDGRLLVSGGDDSPVGLPMVDGIGVANLSAYDPLQPLSWQQLPQMNAARWYPTVTTMSDGTALIISGSLDLNFTKNKISEVYSPATNTLRDLTGVLAPATPVNGDAGTPVNNDTALGGALYPWMFALPQAQVVKVGPDLTTYTLDTTQLGTWQQGPNRPETDGLIRDYGSAVLVGKLALAFGGGGAADPGPPPTNSVAGLDLTTSTWAALPGMAIGRRQHTATILPDGRTLITAGSFGPGFSNFDTPATPAEVYDHVQNKWTLLPAEAVSRGYHSSAFLLPDGRVIVGGGGEGAGVPSFQSTAETYFPDYWFKPRPTLIAPPTNITYDAPFQVQSSSPIGKVTLIRVSSVTHAFNQNQRYMELPFPIPDGGAGTQVSVVVPSDGWTPPGHYILFVLDQSNVPSMGAIVKVGP